MNRSVLIGRLTKDVELRYTPNGVAVANFTIAVNRPFKNQNGDSEADFIPIVVWRKQAENAANYIGKGSMVGIDGRIQTRNYDNDEGKRVYITEIVADSVQFLDSRKNDSGAPQPQNSQPNTNSPGRTQDAGNGQYGGQKPSNNNPFQNDPFGEGEPIDISDDDLPF